MRAKQYIDLYPKHRNWIDPTVGSAAVLLARDPLDTRFFLASKDSHQKGVSEVVCDADGPVMNFWSVLRDKETRPEFLRIASATPFSEDLFERSANRLDNYQPGVDAAIDFFIVSRQSMSGRLQDFTPLSTTRLRRGMNEQASSWMNAVEGLSAIAERLQRVVLLKTRPMIEVLKKYGGDEDTFFFVDPTYPADTRTSPDVYRRETKPDEHDSLLNLITLSTFRSKVMLCSVENDYYDRALLECGFRKVVFEVKNSSSKQKVKGTIRECVYLNYPERT